jgi:hypothetical protein
MHLQRATRSTINQIYIHFDLLAMSSTIQAIAPVKLEGSLEDRHKYAGYSAFPLACMRLQIG